jgi:hypothetical protein
VPGGPAGIVVGRGAVGGEHVQRFRLAHDPATGRSRPRSRLAISRLDWRSTTAGSGLRTPRRERPLGSPGDKTSPRSRSMSATGRRRLPPIRR